MKPTLITLTPRFVRRAAMLDDVLASELNSSDERHE
jgi:hypothetical protein